MRYNLFSLASRLNIIRQERGFQFVSVLPFQKLVMILQVLITKKKNGQAVKEMRLITMIKEYLQSILSTFFKKKEDVGVTISKESNNCIVITINGILLYKDLVQIQNTAKGMLGSGAKINCLILAKKFSGWGNNGKWGDLKFMYESDPFINKIAIVADGKWKDELLMFVGEGLRKATVKFFLSDRENAARFWLSKSAG